VLLALFALVLGPVGSLPADAAERLRPYDGCFVLRDDRGRTQVVNPERARRRLPPYSTFKIPNTLIGLEEGAISGAGHRFAWGGRKPLGRSEIERDLGLKEAFGLSAVWAYQDVARQVGRPAMQRHVRAIGYGNRDASGPIASFWLGSTLKISALEQAEFLDRLARDQLPRNRLPFDVRHVRTVREVMEDSTGPGWTLGGKTGSGPEGLGWYVGIVQRGSRHWTFALNLDAKPPAGFAAKDLAKGLLRDAKLID
jgi:beta-lactamase class D